MKNKKHKQVQGKCYLSKWHLFFFICGAIISTTLKLNAQTVQSKFTGNDIKIVNDLANHKVDIEFIVDKEIFNLLVLITDSLGNALFLDNQYRFKGNYKRSVVLKEAQKGVCFLKIGRDGDQFIKNLIIE